MPNVRQLTLSHRYLPKLQHMLAIKEKAGWIRCGDVYSCNNVHCIDISIDTYVTIYTSISGVLFPTSDREQEYAFQALKHNDLTRINFLPNAVGSLISLLDTTDARLKVHSMWRYSFYDQKDKLAELFLRNGFQEEHLHPDFFVGFKGKDANIIRDIEFSVSDNSSMNIVIDTDFMQLCDFFKLYLVDSNFGFQSSDVFEIKNLIGREKRD